MSSQLVQVEIQEHGVAVVTIQRPEALNALNREVLAALDAAFAALAQKAEVRAVILTGAGKAFVAGADIREMADFGPDQAKEYALYGQQVFNRIAVFKRPVIAAVNGFALGGGCELALACDLRIASEKAKFGQPEVNLGVTPGFGGTQRLARAIGAAQAKLLLFTGEIVPAQRALELGLVQEVVPPEALLGRCVDLANTMAAKAALAVALCKQAVDEGLDMQLSGGLVRESALFARTFASADQKEGMAAFLEKRPPCFKTSSEHS